MFVCLISPEVLQGRMASAKTSSFWLTEQVNLASTGVTVQGNIDLGAYVDVGDQQALAIEEVEYILQAYDTVNNSYSYSIAGTTPAGGLLTVGMQLTDLNRGLNIVSADDRSLVSSGAFLFSNDNNSADNEADMYPDSFGPASAQGARLVVNDSLYFNARINNTTLNANREIRVTVRIKAKIVKVSRSDWMAIAIQSTAADN